MAAARSVGTEECGKAVGFQLSAFGHPMKIWWMLSACAMQCPLLTIANMKRKAKAVIRGKLYKAVEELKRKMAVEAVKRHGTAEAAAKELGLTEDGLEGILKRHGYRLKRKIVQTVELEGPK